MTSDLTRGISSPLEGSDREIWSRRQPAGHTAVCWASALGRAHHLHPFEDPLVLPDRALTVLRDEPAQCKCRSRNKGIPGRRAR